jgi:hypothetical protein
MHFVFVPVGSCRLFYGAYHGRAFCSPDNHAFASPRVVANSDLVKVLARIHYPFATPLFPARRCVYRIFSSLEADSLVS